MSKSYILVFIPIAVLLGAVVLALAGPSNSPVQIVRNYGWQMLAEEAVTMNECAECHEGEEFHTCDHCHDDHGAVELEDTPFFAGIILTGDVPEPGFVLLHDVLPYPDHPFTHKPLLTCLTEQGIESFESVTLGSNDGGFVTIDAENLTERALLLPYADGIRFASEDLHVSTWIKGITRIVVIGPEKPLQIDGTATSMGRLLIGPTRSATVEQTNVMLKSDEDGQIRRAKTASRIEGAPVALLVADAAFESLQVRTEADETLTLDAEAAAEALLATLRGKPTLLLPSRGRPQWITGVVEIRSQ
ncbi:MAG: hypothetical protein ACP5JG_01620 [Anaerolineae bacterium]